MDRQPAVPFRAPSRKGVHMRSLLVLVSWAALFAAGACAHPRPDSSSPSVRGEVPATQAREPAEAGVASVAQAVEVDHIYVVTSPGAPEVAALRAAGFAVSELRSNHTGNGSSSMSVIFENAYLELLCADSTVSDSANSPADRAHWHRVFDWRTSGASPVGVGLRRLAAGPDSLPFPTERLPAMAWIRPGTNMHLVTTSADSLAPGVFVVPRYMALTGWIDDARRDTAFAAYLRHPLNVRQVTGVRVVVTHPDGIPPTVRLLREAGVLRIEQGADPMVELTFDGGTRGATRDFRPDLPLVIRY